MKTFKVNVQRSQIQTQTFVVKAVSKADLEKKLAEFDFGFIDGRFDEGEVDSIGYDVVSIEPCKEKGHTFASDDLQECLDSL